MDDEGGSTRNRPPEDRRTYMNTYKTLETKDVTIDDVLTLEDGSSFEFTLKNGEAVRAIALGRTLFDIHFILQDCLKDLGVEMGGKGIEDWGKSRLRAYLNEEVLALFPDELVDMMDHYGDGDLLTVPSETEVFGPRHFSEGGRSGERRFAPMQKARNRIACNGPYGPPMRYWLRDKAFGRSFSIVDRDGSAGTASASMALGVRPMFRLVLPHTGP